MLNIHIHEMCRHTPHERYNHAILDFHFADVKSIQHERRAEISKPVGIIK